MTHLTQNTKKLFVTSTSYIQNIKKKASIESSFHSPRNIVIIIMGTTFYDLPPEVLYLIFGYTAGIELVQISSLFRIVIPILPSPSISSYTAYTITSNIQPWKLIRQNAKTLTLELESWPGPVGKRSRSENVTLCS
jgi:hypothetical protein